MPVAGRYPASGRLTRLKQRQDALQAMIVCWWESLSHLPLS